MKEEWAELEEFPNYVVSNYGVVANMSRGGSELRVSPNQFGVLRVGLVRDRVQYTRGLANLVATAFVDRPNEIFNTPIHLDGDTWNCRADNLLWRPRSFAVRFHGQFNIDAFHDNYRSDVVDVETGDVYPGVKEVCMTFGLYWYDVIKSCVEGTHVPYTLQEFQYA